MRLLPSLFFAAFAIACTLLTGCKDSLVDRSLIFSTATTLGVEVAVNPSEGATGPVKLVIGYKRAEGVLNPVYHSEGVVGPALNRQRITDPQTGAVTETTTPVTGSGTTVQRYLPVAYSVIAKIAGEATANAKNAAEGKIAVGQWFATGRAADLLAVQPGIAGAVVGSGAVAEAAAKQVHGVATFKDSVSQVYADKALSTTASGLAVLAVGDAKHPADTTAAGRLKAMDSFAAALLPPIWIKYQQTPDGKGLERSLRAVAVGSPHSEALVQYVNSAESSAAALRAGLALDTFQLTGDIGNDKIVEDPAHVGDGEPIDKTSARRGQLAAEADRLEAAAASIRKQISQSDAVAQAMEYFFKVITGSN